MTQYRCQTPSYLVSQSVGEMREEAIVEPVVGYFFYHSCLFSVQIYELAEGQIFLTDDVDDWNEAHHNAEIMRANFQIASLQTDFGRLGLFLFKKFYPMDHESRPGVLLIVQ